MTETSGNGILQAIEDVRWDLWLAASTIGLVLFGVVMVYSASVAVAADRFHNQNYFLVRQLVWVTLGLAAMLVLMRVDYRRYAHPVIVFGLLGASLLMLVAALFFPARNGAHRWISLGSLSAQPSELAKIALVVFLARFLVKREAAGEAHSFKLTVLPASVIAGLLAALIMKEPDLGTTAMLGVIFVVMLMVGSVPLRYFAAFTVPMLLGFYFFVLRVPWRYERLMVFLHPERDPLGKGYQALQSKLAVGSGGVYGMGLGGSKQKLHFLPEPQVDFIFGVIAEELGLIGTIAVILVFGLFLWRGLRLSLSAPDRFGQLLGIGLTTMIIAQAFFNMSVVLGLVPTKGIPLPFVSYGGSSLVFALAAVGVMLNISEQGRESQPEGGRRGERQRGNA